ncbi:MAG TPA: hypothetical protein VKN76_15170 [Kiloniellaceae bacterium]|nr:hypothetical protein [Kiloniellaceae bacterium]
MPLDSTGKANLPFDHDGLMTGILNHLPEDDRGLFSEDHVSALRKACDKLKWSRHPVDIRLSIPTLFSRYYLVLVGGPERRSGERRADEKRRHPFQTVGNFLFLGALIALGLYAVVFIETLLFIGISETILK